MEKSVLIWSCVLILALCLSVNSQVALCDKYLVDGELDDWGIDLMLDWSENSTWLPDSGISFVIEDNFDPQYSRSPSGVHIKGTGSSYVAYLEPMVKNNNGDMVLEPYGTDYYDIEAMYFDQDDDCIYLAVVTGENPDIPSGDARPGDLALNLDGDLNTGQFGFEYGVKLGSVGLEQFSIYNETEWCQPFYVPENAPSVLLGGNKVGEAQGVYVDSGIEDNGYTNYVIEVAIPKSAVGSPGRVSIYNTYLSEGCGNDDVPGAPEYLVGVLAVLMVSPAFAYLIVKKRN